MNKQLTDFYAKHELEENSRWFVLIDLSRANANMPGYKILEKEQITYFTPMHYVVKKKNGKGNRIKEPVIKSLLFAYANKDHLNQILKAHTTIKYRYIYGHTINDPMVVPKDDMDRFIYATISSTKDLIYFLPEEITPDKCGKKVCIIGGSFDGYSGHLLKVQGSKFKRLLVELKGIFAAGVEVDAEYIKFV